MNDLNRMYKSIYFDLLPEVLIIYKYMYNCKLIIKRPGSILARLGGFAFAGALCFLHLQLLHDLI